MCCDARTGQWDPGRNVENGAWLGLNSSRVVILVGFLGRAQQCGGLNAAKRTHDQNPQSHEV